MKSSLPDREFNAENDGVLRFARSGQIFKIIAILSDKVTWLQMLISFSRIDAEFFCKVHRKLQFLTFPEHQRWAHKHKKWGSSDEFSDTLLSDMDEVF